MLIARHKQLVCNAFQGLLHQKLVFSRAQNYANWQIIVWLTHFCFETIQIEVHLPYITMLYLCSF
jgi:hypothetical protein